METTEQVQFDFSTNSDYEIVERFNGDLGRKGWVSSRGIFLDSLRREFDQRKINTDDISADNGFCLRKEYASILNGKKLYRIDQFIRNMVNIALYKTDGTIKETECYFKKIRAAEMDTIDLTKEIKYPVLISIEYNLVGIKLVADNTLNDEIIFFDEWNNRIETTSTDKLNSGQLPIHTKARSILIFPDKKINGKELMHIEKYRLNRI